MTEDEKNKRPSRDIPSRAFDGLRLNSIERFHVYSCAPDFPNLILCRFQTSAKLDRVLFELAGSKIADRQGLSGRFINSDQRLAFAFSPPPHKINWQWSDRSHEEQHAQFDAPLVPSPVPSFAGFESKFSDAVRSNVDLGLHVWCVHDHDSTWVMLGIHHAVGDGIGGIQTINELLAVYDNLRCGREWQHGLGRLDFQRLTKRNRLGLNSWKYWKHGWKQPIAIIGMGKFLLRKFVVLSPPNTNKADDLSPTTEVGLRGRWIEAPQTAAIERLAKEKSLTSNSVFMAAVFRAADQWQERHGGPQKQRWFRMVLPISLRSKNDFRMPVTNRATLVQVDRDRKQMRDRASFLFYLDREVKIIVGWQFDKLFLMIVRLMSVSETWLRRAAQKKSARGTLVFTNLGEPFRAIRKRVRTIQKRMHSNPLSSNTKESANTTSAESIANTVKETDISKETDVDSTANMVTELKEFDFGGPIRTGMPINFTVQKHNQRYRISLRFDTRVVTPQQADDFLAYVDEELRAFYSSTNRTTTVSA